MSRPKQNTAPHEVQIHRSPEDASDRIAFGFVKLLRFFAERYGHRAVVLETVAAVPGMVGGLLQHLKALRHIRNDEGWIRELLDEAENERMHLMIFVQIARPTLAERFIIMITQAVFSNFYFFLYLFAPKTAHRVVGYFEEEAVTCSLSRGPEANTANKLAPTGMPSYPGSCGSPVSRVVPFRRSA